MKICDDLRQAVLQAAIQGKLTTQHEEDGDAKNLFKAVCKEREEYLLSNKLKPDKFLNDISEEDKLYNIPSNWIWVRLGSLGAGVRYPFADGPFGSNLKKEHYIDKPEVRIIQLSNIGEFGWKDINVKYTSYEHLETISRSEVCSDDIVIAKMMPAGRAIIVPKLNTKFVLSSDAVKFVPSHLLNINYLLLAINSSTFREQIYDEVQGITRVRTSLLKLKTYMLPLPPLAEQHRIVAKVDKLMAEIDELEKVENELVALKDAFPNDMKSALLQYAMQGKLTTQRKEDGNAKDLLEQIAAEKAKLIKEGKLKKEKPLAEITEDEKPFDIPENWEWVRLKTIGITMTGNTPSTMHKEYYNGNIPFIGPANITYNGEISYATDKKLTEEGERFARIALSGSILQVCIGGSIGKCVMIDRKVAFNQQINAIYPLVCCNEYVQKVMSSLYFVRAIKNTATGTATPIINRAQWENLIIPLPPLVEQERIVAKLDKLLPLCESLKEA